MTLVQAGSESGAARGVIGGSACCGRLGYYWRPARLYDMVGLRGQPRPARLLPCGTFGTWTLIAPHESVGYQRRPGEPGGR